MKTIFVIASFLVAQNSLALGDPSILPDSRSPLSPQESQYLNDMGETTATLNQFTEERGHEDQQNMEQKEMDKVQDLEDTKKESIDIQVEEIPPE